MWRLYRREIFFWAVHVLVFAVRIAAGSFKIKPSYSSAVCCRISPLHYTNLQCTICKNIRPPTVQLGTVNQFSYFQQNNDHPFHGFLCCVVLEFTRSNYLLPFQVIFPIETCNCYTIQNQFVPTRTYSDRKISGGFPLTNLGRGPF